MQQRQRMMQSFGLAAMLALASVLSACGFQLRGTPSFAFDSIYIVTPANAAVLGAELKRRLQVNAQLQVLDEAAAAARAQVVLEVLSEQREKVVVALNAVGQVREFQLRTRVRFKLRSQRGTELIADTEILQQRDISFNETLVLAKEAEENLLYRDMQADIAQQLVRRLAAVKDIR